jgi:VanZ family protein
MLLKSRLIRWLPALLWMATIFCFSSLSHLPEAESGWVDYGIKKSAHIIVYAGLALLYRFALSDEPRLSPRRLNLTVLLLVLLYAISDEWHQSFTPGRHPRVHDIGYDLIGGLVGLTLAQIWSRLNLLKGSPLAFSEKQPEPIPHRR